MRLRIFLSALLVAVAVREAAAQPQHRFGVRLGARYNLNTRNVDADQKLLTARNTITPALTAVYNFRLKNGIFFEGGLTWGALNEKIHFAMPLSEFDPEATNALRTVLFSDHRIYELPYLAPHIAIGYSFRLNKQLSLDVSGGISQSVFLKQYSDADRAMLRYNNDSRTNTREVIVYYHRESLGNPVDNFEFQAFVRKKRKLARFSSLTAGFRASCNMKQKTNPMFYSLYREEVDGSFNTLTYTARNIGIQFLIGAYL